MKGSRARPRNDWRQYDDLVAEWWRPHGRFAALHWLAAARAQLLPSPRGLHDVLLDVGCGGGLMAAHVRGFLHVGIDLNTAALEVAARHGVRVVRADATRLPVADESIDIVVAGEILEHVPDLESCVGELSRVLRPGGKIVIDTINATPAARLVLVTVGERLPGGPPPLIHDPALFVDPRRLRRLFERHGVELRVWGLRPSFLDYVGFLLDRSRPVRMVPGRSLAVLYQGVGTRRK